MTVLRPTNDPRPDYRPGVGIVLLNADGLVFVAQRRDLFTEAWQLPQGGIDAGETPRQAALRELEEEIGTRQASYLAECPRWLSYDLPPDLARTAWGGKYRGQCQKWFAFRFTGADSDIDLNTAEPEFSAWRWAPLATIPDLIVPFKRALYGELVASFRHLVAADA